MTLPASNSVSFLSRYQIWIVLLLSVVLMNTPFVSIPFNWLETYFHEISHGIAALLTGGNVLSIELFVNGAGLCTVQGGISAIIAFSGYFGATLWGTAIYCSCINDKAARIVLFAISTLLISSLIFWSKDVLTFVILSVLLAIFLVLIYFKNNQLDQWIVKVIGATVLLNSLLSPLALLDRQSVGDGAALAQLTFIPEIVWVIIWLGVALFALRFLTQYAQPNYKNKNSKP